MTVSVDVLAISVLLIYQQYEKYRHTIHGFLKLPLLRTGLDFGSPSLTFLFLSFFSFARAAPFSFLTPLLHLHFFQVFILSLCFLPFACTFHLCLTEWKRPWMGEREGNQPECSKSVAKDHQALCSHTVSEIVFQFHHTKTRIENRGIKTRQQGIELIYLMSYLFSLFF